MKLPMFRFAPRVIDGCSAWYLGVIAHPAWFIVPVVAVLAWAVS